MKKPIKSRQMDLLHGSMLDKLLLFALPLAASSMLQQMFNSVDAIVVGRFSSRQALAAVGSNSSVISLLINLFVGVSMGINVVAASHIGKKENKGVSDAVHTSAVIALVSGFFLLITGILIARPLLTLMNTPDDVIHLAVLYLRIYFLGMPFIMIYNFGAAILRSMGDTRRPLYCLIISGIVNTILNLILVIIFQMSVAGVAIATVTANAVDALLVTYFLMHEQEPFRFHPKKMAVHQTELIRALQIGIPAGLQGMVFSLANVFLQSGINSFGSKAVAGSAAALNYEFLTYFIISAFAQATVTFTSQNYSAGNVSRCKKALVESLLAGCALCALLSVVLVAGRGFFIQFFTKNAQVAQFAYTRMLNVMLLEFMTGFYEMTAAAMRGLGYSLTPALLTVFGTCVLRIIWLYTVCQKIHSFRVLMAVYPISWFLTGILMAAAYFIVSRRAFAKLR